MSIEPEPPPPIVAVSKADLEALLGSMEAIQKLAREEMSLAGSRYSTIRPRQMIMFAWSAKRIIARYLQEKSGINPQ